MIPPQGSVGAAQKILVVDDEEDIVAYLVAVLEDNGFMAVGESDAASAKARIERDPPDLILLDILMPGQGGLSLYRGLRGSPATAVIPVVMITGFSREEDFSRTLSRLEGERPPLPDGYLEKPISIPRLLQTLRELSVTPRQRIRHG